MASRTNNAAESVHAQMNPEVNGTLSIFNFIRIIEEQMKRTNDRILAGCQPERRAVESTKNRVLAVELEKLLIGRQGVLGSLDNCGSVVRMKRDADAKAFVPQVIPPFEDIEWISEKRVLVEEAALCLYHRLHPGGQMADRDVFGSVASWAFQVPPNPEVQVGPSQSRFSLVDQGPRKSYVETRERLEKERGILKNSKGQWTGRDENVEETNEEMQTRKVVRVVKRKEGNETEEEIEVDEDTW